jgi:hypothetical protein
MVELYFHSPISLRGIGFNWTQGQLYLSLLHYYVLYSAVQCNKLLLALASTVSFGFRPRLDPRPHFYSFHTFTCFRKMGPCLRERRGLTTTGRSSFPRGTDWLLNCCWLSPAQLSLGCEPHGTHGHILLTALGPSDSFPPSLSRTHWLLTLLYRYMSSYMYC